MTADAPAWRALSPEDAADLPLRDLLPTGEAFSEAAGGCVALQVAPGAREAEWARRTALALAGSWARDGGRIVLADLSGGNPEAVPLRSGGEAEGIHDVLLFGASIRRVARVQDEGGFYLVPSGTPVADPSSIFEHRRWGDLLDGFREASVTLVAYVPEGAPGSDGFVARADHRILFASEEEWRERRAAGVDSASLPTAVVGPASSSPGDSATSPGHEGGVGASEGAGAVGASAEPAHDPAQGSQVPSAAAEESTSEPVSREAGTSPAPARKGTRPKAEAVKRRVSPWLLVLLVLVVLGAVAAAWLGYVEIPGVDFSGLVTPSFGSGSPLG